MLFLTHRTLLQNSETQFFSYTEHDNELSLIIDAGALEYFSRDVVQIFEEPYNIIQIELGSCDTPCMQTSSPLPALSYSLFTAEGGTVAMVGKLLAQKEIAVHYLSTFQHDFVLVRHLSFRGSIYQSLARCDAFAIPLLPNLLLYFLTFSNLQ